MTKGIFKNLAVFVSQDLRSSTYIVFLEESKVSKHAEPHQETSRAQEPTAFLVHVVFLFSENRVMFEEINTSIYV